MKYLIFDFDGVLGDTFEARVEVIEEMDGKSREEVIVSGDKYFTKSTHTRDLNVSESDLQRMTDWNTRFANLLAKKEWGLFTGFIEEIKRIKDIQLAVVSSGCAVYIKPKLEESGLTFTHILTFEDHHSKEEKVGRICRDWNIPVRDAYFFTDTISDVVELRTIMSKIYGCTWGFQGYEKLATVLDEAHILRKFSDIQKAIIL